MPYRAFSAHGRRKNIATALYEHSCIHCWMPSHQIQLEWLQQKSRGICWLCWKRLISAGQSTGRIPFPFKCSAMGPWTVFSNYAAVVARIGQLGFTYTRCAWEKPNTLHLKTAWPFVLTSLNLINDSLLATTPLKFPCSSQQQPHSGTNRSFIHVTDTAGNK